MVSPKILLDTIVKKGLIQFFQKVILFTKPYLNFCPFSSLECGQFTNIIQLTIN